MTSTEYGNGVWVIQRIQRWQMVLTASQSLDGVTSQNPTHKHGDG